MAKAKNNAYLAVIAQQTRIQTELLKKIDERQDKISENLLIHDTKSEERGKNTAEVLRQYFRLIIILITALGALVGLKIYMS